MEYPKVGVGWYVTQQDVIYGPVAFEDLKFEVACGELKPNMNRVWREGLKSWILAGEVDGLFDEKQRNLTGNDIAFEELVDEDLERKDWGGIDRTMFFLLVLVLPVLMGMGLLFVREKVDEGLMPLLLNVCGSVAGLVLVISIFKRFKNLAMSYWWVLGLFVPLVNLWLGSRLFACPEGYAEDKDLDGIGWFLSWVYWFPIAIMMGLGAFAAIRGPEAVERLLDMSFLQGVSF